MPEAGHAIVLDSPALTSDEGLPLANGLLGALIWGDGAPLTISLDRTDLWDLRDIPEYTAPDYRLDRVLEKHRAGLHDLLIEELEAPYHRPGPTKIPAGRIQLFFEGGQFHRASLPVAAPIGNVDLGTVRVRIGVHAESSLGFLETEGATPRLRLVAPAFGERPEGWTKPEGFDASSGDVWELGYPPPEISEGEGWQAFTQAGHDEFRFAVALRWRQKGDRTFACWTIATNDDAEDPLAWALAATDKALALGFDALAAGHLAWWSRRAAKTTITLPDAAIERAYALDLYKFDAAAARSGAPPISLQGPWTSDNGRLPPWKGDYHHDLNTQMTYWPALPAGRVEEHRGFLDWLWDTRGECVDWTRRFFRVDGLNVPMTADLRNRQIGGWRQYTHSLSSGAWLAEHFAAHWRYTSDASFLEARAYPYLADVCTFIDAITQARDPDGYRAPPISSSPEIHHNQPEAWFERITNYDLALFRSALDNAAELADTLGRSAEGARWRSVADELPPLARDGDRLLIAPGAPLHESHRHFSHLMAIHPLTLVDPHRSAEERRIATASLNALEPLGTNFWMGYSFAWVACLKAQVGDGDGALAALRAYADAFLLPNSFHANGDFANKGYSKAVFRAFTLEGNCAAAQAVHEMLLQCRGNTIRLFPALPGDWLDVSFTGLCAHGGVRVDATLRAGRLEAVTLHADRPVEVRLALHDAPASLDIAAGSALRLSPTQLQALNEAAHVDQLA